MFVGHPGKLRGVFLNYLLDCLPASMLHWTDEGTKQLCVRTYPPIVAENFLPFSPPPA